jgi:hypothetical protein
MNPEFTALLSQPDLSIREYAALRRVHYITACKAVRAGQVETILVNKRRRILTAPLRKMHGQETAA